MRAEEYAHTRAELGVRRVRNAQAPAGSAALEQAAEEGYVRRYLAQLSAGGLRGLRVLVYQHSAVGRDLLPRILRELGADVFTAGRSETFVPIDTENITDEQLDRLEELVAGEGRGRSRFTPSSRPTATPIGRW